MENTKAPTHFMAGCVDVDLRDGVLLLYREDRGDWEFPGGKPDPGETPAETAEREGREETDEDVAIEDYLGELALEFTVVKQGKPEMRRVLYRYFAAKFGANPRPAAPEHTEVRRFSPDELAECRKLGKLSLVVKSFMDSYGFGHST